MKRALIVPCSVLNVAVTSTGSRAPDALIAKRCFRAFNRFATRLGRVRLSPSMPRGWAVVWSAAGDLERGVGVAQDHGGSTAGRDRDQVVGVGLDLDAAEIGSVVIGVLQVGSEGLAPQLTVLLLGGVLGEQRREVGGEGRAGRGQDGHVGLLGACDFRLTWNGARANPMAWVGARGVL